MTPNYLQQLEALLKTHDWFYMYSDDPSAYRCGLSTDRNIKQLMTICKSNSLEEESKKLYNKYYPKITF